jgi:hypothetical protein
MTINLEKLLDLTIAAKLDSKFLDDIKHMVTAEMESEISKKTGKKNLYKNIQKYIAFTKKLHRDRPRESLYGVFQGKNNYWHITNGFGGIRFNNLDVKDLPIITDNPPIALDEIMDDIKKGCNIPIDNLPTEKELMLSFTNQKAEAKNSNDYAIYYKVGSHYYDPEQLIYLFSLMGENCKGFEGQKKNGMFIVDDEGNQMVVLYLREDGLNIRETKTD